MTGKRQQQVRRAQKESFLLRQIADAFLRISLDEPRLHGLYINRVQLSPDRSKCYVYFHSPEGVDDFKAKLSTLILYKPSIRTAVAKALESRYTPELEFVYDVQFDKQRKIEDLIDQLKNEGRL